MLAGSNHTLLITSTTLNTLYRQGHKLYKHVCQHQLMIYVSLDPDKQSVDNKWNPVLHGHAPGVMVYYSGHVLACFQKDRPHTMRVSGRSSQHILRNILQV